MLGDAVAHFPGEVEAAAVVLEQIDDPQALLVVIEAARHQRVDDALAGMTERGVAEIVAERDRFGKLLVQPQHLGDRARDLRDLERVGQSRPVMISGRREEDLGLVLQPAERLAVNDAIAVTLKRRAHVVFRLGPQSPLRSRALCRLRRENLQLPRLELLADRHARISGRKLVPFAIGPTPKIVANVWPTSAKLRRVPRSTLRRTRAPATSSGTYSRE
jgi:hypothetical protein